MQTTMLSIAALALFGSLAAAELPPANAAIIPYPIYRPETVAESRVVRLRNSQNNYVIKFVESKPEGTKPGNFQIRLREPSIYYSFSRPIQDFLRIKVGDLSLTNLSPDLEKLTVWNRDGASGADLPLNFGGKAYTVSFLLKPDSPVLHIALSTTEPQSDKVEIALNMVVSEMTPGQFEGTYQRAADSATRTLGMEKKPQPLTSADRYLILYDNERQPGKSTNKNCIGPCLVQWDGAALQKSEITLQNSYHTQIRFYPASDFKRFEFGLYESSTPRDNATFKEYIKQYLP